MTADINDDALAAGNGDVDVAARHFVVLVNARSRQVEGREQDFLDVVRLAFPDAVLDGTVTYTVTYKHGPHENPQGTMVEGDTVFIKNGMRFHVTKTDKS